MAELLTHSRIKMLHNCPMKEHIRYGLQLARKTQKQALSIGKAVHLGLETRSVETALSLFDDIYPSSQEESDALEIDKATVSAMLTGYFTRYDSWPQDTKHEIEFNIPIINPATKAKSKTFRLAGKIDALVPLDGKWWIVEYKTASQINQGYFERLLLDNQITTYMYAVQKAFGIDAAGVIYRVLKKPSIRPTKKETIDQYCQRLERDYLERPDFYFYEQKLYRSPDDLAQFERELWAITQDMIYKRRNNLCFKNPSHCLDWGKCEYMPICTNEPEWRLLYEQRAAHEELEGKANGFIA